MNTRLVGLALVFLGCSGASSNSSPPVASDPPIVTVASVATPVLPPEPPASADASGPLKGDLRAPFGGAAWGFVEASSINGRFVFLRRFKGAQEPSFGHHGEPMGDWPELVAVDLLAGRERILEEVIDVAPGRRYFLLLDNKSVWLLDSESGVWTGLDADLENDRNACLPPRQATFSADGQRVAWVKKGSQVLGIRNLGNGESWAISAQGRLWRGWSDNDGRGGVLAEVPTGSTEWPRQNTSCACRWCGRFALSHGFYGWSGPKFAMEHVAEDGTRKASDPPEGKRQWHGQTSARCEIEPAKANEGLEYGPWKWKCP